jgi:hypothetical protein
MILTKGANPEINVVYIGAFVINRLQESKGRKMKITILMKLGESELSISIDHMILTLDWLYTISAIKYNNNEVSINETAQINDKG